MEETAEEVARQAKLRSLAEQIAAARIKGLGMRWNVQDLNALLALRGVFLAQAWQSYWNSWAQRAA